MKGSYRVKVYSKRLAYDFTISKKVTILTGDSGTGKSTFINMIANSNISAGVTLECDVDCAIYAIEVPGWEYAVDYDNTIIFMDEQFIGTNSSKIVEIIQKSKCYFVLVTRVIPKGLKDYDIYEISDMRKFTGQETG